MTDLDETISYQMSLLATFETGIDAAVMCLFFAGEFLQRLSLDSESINLDRGWDIIMDHVQDIQLYRFVMSVFLILANRYDTIVYRRPHFVPSQSFFPDTNGQAMRPSFVPQQSYEEDTRGEPW